MKQRGEGTTFDFRALLEKQNRTRLAVVLGGAAMLLLLLSELLPATPPAEPSAASASQALVYREQLEAQLQDLIGQIDGAGATAVMVTLETGEETVYATDTQSGQTQSQETHVLLDDGTALAQTVYYPQVCGVAVVRACAGIAGYFVYPDLCRTTPALTGCFRTIKSQRQGGTFP